MLLFVAVAVEAISWVAGSIAFGARFSRERLHADRSALAESRGRVAVTPRWIQDEVLHPYLGFLPARRLHEGRFGVEQATPASGPTGAADEIVVAVIGGSFAHQFAEEGLPHLIDRLRELPELRGRTLVSLSAAAGGHKQPQQLMTVAYLLALGERFDILINLDGFNDIALHPTENAPARVFPAYPRRWHQRVAGVLSREGLRVMLRRAGLEDRRRDLARTFSRAPWRSLNTTNLIYLVLDGDAERRLVDADRGLLDAERRATAPIAATGPPMEFADDRAMFTYLVDLWRRSSRAINEVAAGHGVRYYHFLQPNQYVPASKPMGPDEKRDALRSIPYRRIVETTYPRLREAGRTLTATGVRFEDLSTVFATHGEPLYIDGCCHVNRRGNLILADRIFDVIRRDLSAKGSAALPTGAVRPSAGFRP